MRGVANVWAAEPPVREPADRDDAATVRELGEEGSPLVDLYAGGPPVRRLRPRMRWHEVPEQDVVLEPELGEDAVNDRRGRLGRAGSGELPLRRQGDPRDAGTAIAGRLAHEEQRGSGLRVEIGGQPVATELRVGVLVVGRADPCPREPLDESRCHPSSLGGVQRRRVVVHGHVQGVFFRETTRRRAASAGVSGWIRNLPDGRVEALFEGERDAVDRLVRFMREGPRGARVDWVDVASEEPEGLSGFQIR